MDKHLKKSPETERRYRSRSTSQSKYHRSRSLSRKRLSREDRKNSSSQGNRNREKKRKRNNSILELINSGKFENFKFTKSSHSQPRKNHTSIPFNKLFSQPNSKSFIAEDNITIGIERNIQGNVPAIIPQRLDLNCVVIVRRRDEGDISLSDRLEFDNDQDIDDIKTTSLDSVAVVAAAIHFGSGPLATDFSRSFDREYDRRREHFQPNWSNFRYSERQHGNLPDFGRRPDRGKIQAWQLKPDMVPKGRSYFEHDNRTEFRSNNSDNNRRQSYRGRRERPYNQDQRDRNYSQDINYKENTSANKWTHDKFSEMEENNNPMVANN